MAGEKTFLALIELRGESTEEVRATFKGENSSLPDCKSNCPEHVKIQVPNLKRDDHIFTPPPPPSEKR